MLKKLFISKKRLLSFLMSFAMMVLMVPSVVFASSTQITGVSTQAQTVYAGPSSSNYVTIGSIGSGEKVYILGKEKGENWYHIQYHAGSKQKSGYVPTSTITSISGGTPQEESFYGGYAYSNAAQTVWSCDDSSLAVNIGSIGQGEGVTRLYAYGNVMFIEYSTSSGAKRGYVYSPNFIYPISETCVARVKSSSTVSYGYKAGYNYLSVGSVGTGEDVAILATSNSLGIAWIEYNTNSGRKRGYMSLSNLEKHNPPSNFDDLPGFYYAYTTITQVNPITVYAGPSEKYAVVGSVGANEEIKYNGSININGIWYYNIYYYVTGTNSLKSGYIRVN